MGKYDRCPSHCPRLGTDSVPPKMVALGQVFGTLVKIPLFHVSVSGFKSGVQGLHVRGGSRWCLVSLGSSCPHGGQTGGLGSWMWLGPALAMAGTWELNQKVRNLLVCFPLPFK